MKAFSCYLIILGALLLSSCEDELNIPPPSKLSLEQAHGTTEGLDQTITAAYRQMGDPSASGGRYIWWGDVFADLVGNNNATSGENLDIFNRNFAGSPGEDDLRACYRAINWSNEVLRSIEIDRPKDSLYARNKDRIRGEALFIRGACNFEMVRYYGPQWGNSSDNSDLGVVLTTQPVEGLLLPSRSTVAQTYQAVINDLTAAVELLPDAFNPARDLPSYRGRATKDAARAYLARVYFQQGTEGYSQALTYINSIVGSTPGVIEKYPLASSVVDPFSQTGETAKSSEVIFQLISVPGQNLSSGLRQRYAIPITGEPTNPYAVSNTFFSTTQFYENDKRKTDLLTKAGNDRWFTRKYNLENMNIPKIRSAELVLDRAEISALSNNTSAAIEDVNLVRNRAGIPALDNTLTNEAVLDSIRIERVRELAFEGDRLHDLRRRRAQIPAGERQDVQPLPWNSNALLMKYSQGELNKNQNLQQNPD
jgi:hypothetical protein